MGHCGDAAHALENVEHEALGLQKALLLTLDGHDDVTGLHMGSVFDIDFHLHCGVEATEHFLGYLHTSEDALFLDEELALSVGISRDAAERGVVAIANVFGKGEIDESIIEFFYA